MHGRASTDFETACALAESLRPPLPGHQMPDLRPLELRKLADAEHPTCLYYQYLHLLANWFQPLTAVEIGTHAGTSAAHLAHGHDGSVITVDNNPAATAAVNALGYRNIKAHTADSSEAGAALFMNGVKCDVLYIDGNHTFNQAWGEYVLYRRLVRNGGLILIDDVDLEMDGDEMNVMWSLIPEPKMRADWLHATGFGIVKKVDAIDVPPWAKAVRIATPLIETARTTPRRV